MSSFARVCADFSNNLRNIGRIPWNNNNNNSSSPTSLVSSSRPPSTVLSNNNIYNIGSNASNPTADAHSRKVTGSGVTNVPSHDRQASSPTRGTSYTVADIKQRLFTQGLKLELSPRTRRKKSTRFRDYVRLRIPQPHKVAAELWSDAVFVRHLFEYVHPRQYGTLARVCRLWHYVLIDGRFWSRHTKILVDLGKTDECPMLTTAGLCLTSRGLHSLELRHARDPDMSGLEAGFTTCAQRILHLRVEISSLSDQSLLRLVRLLDHVTHLELYCCNDLTDTGVQSCLVETQRLKALSIVDCVHISDRSFGTIAATLPYLEELTIQAYHITDTALTLFSAEQSVRLEKVKLNFCMELTNFGVRNLVLTLRGVRELSLAGCSKVSDDAVDILCENLKQLTALDLSWCGLVTDGALECISVDLQDLQELKLDRCTAITDFGINYLNNLTKLRTLCLRFCSGLSDTSLIHILNIISLRSLSLAGCRRFTENGLSALVRHGRFRVLEVTHCPAFTESVSLFMAQDMPNCIILT